MADIALPTDCALSDVELFADVPAEARARLEAQCTWHQLPAGALVIDARAKAPHGVFVLIAGEVEVHRYDAEGEAVPLGRLSATAYFGEFAAIDGKPGSASVRTRTPCLLAEIAAEPFVGLLNAYPDISLRLLQRAVSLVRTLGDGVVSRRASETFIAEAYKNAVLRSL